MKNGIKKLKNRKNLPIVATFLVMFTLGLAVASIFYSNQLTQQVDLKGIDGYIELQIESPLPSIGFVQDEMSTAIKILRIKSDFESPWELFVVWNSSDLLAAQISGTKDMYEEDYSTVILTNTMTMVQNGTGIVYSSISTFSDWSTIFTQGDSAYLDIAFTFNSGVTSGLIDVTILVTNI